MPDEFTGDEDTRPHATPRLQSRLMALDLALPGAASLPSESRDVLVALGRYAREDYRAGHIRAARETREVVGQRAAELARIVGIDPSEARPDLVAYLCSWLGEDEVAGRNRLLSATFPALKP